MNKMLNVNTGMAGAMRADATRKPIDVEVLLEWTYRRQKADVVAEHGVGLHKIERAVGARYVGSMTADSAAIIANPVRGGGMVSSAAALHEDAEAVHNVVQRLPQPVRGMLIACAKTGSRPSWGEGLHTQVVPRLKDNGKPKIIYTNKICNVPLYCELDVLNPPEYLMKLRNDYLTWWQAMAWLVARFKATESLMAHIITGPAAPYAPWKNQTDQERAVLLLTSEKMFG